MLAIVVSMATGLLARGAPQQDRPTLAIISPAEDTPVTGALTIGLALAGATPVTSLIVYVDGREHCQLSQPPWQCQWDAGPDIREHHVRAVATFADGSRAVANRHTPAITVSERVDVAAVQVPVVVTDASGRFVTGLAARSFTLLEDGRPQRIDTLIDDTVPLDLVLAVDISSSMEGPIGAVRAAVSRLLVRLRPGDATTLLGFNDTMFVLAERETDRALRAAAVEGLVPWGGTALYDATARALEFVSPRAGRRGVVVFSDGDDRHSTGGREPTLARIQEGQVVVYTIGFGRSATPRFRQTLEAFAEASGGRAFFPGGSEDLDPAFDAIFAELANQYVISYVSDRPRHAGWRRLEVRAACAGCRVRAKEGYRATGR